MLEKPTSKTVILQWHRGDALIHGTYIVDTGMTTESVSVHLSFIREDLAKFVDRAFGPHEPVESPTAALDEIKEELVKALVRTISRKWEGPISMAIQADDLERARDDGCRAHFKDINGGILLTIE